MVGKKELIGDVDNVTSYTMLHNSRNILRKRLSGSSIVKVVRLINEEAKVYTRRYLKTMRESINPAFHALVVIDRVIIKIVEFKGILF